LVEHDPRTVAFVRRGLEAEGFVVDVGENGRDGLALVRAFNYPLIVLDRMLPMIDGVEVCRTLRREGCASLLLMLTAKDTLQNKVDGLHGGADDYLTKLLRRGGYRETSRVRQVGDLTLDEATRKVVRGEREVSLTVREFALLSYLMANAGTVVSRARLLSNVWNYSFDPGTEWSTSTSVICARRSTRVRKGR